MIDSHCHLDDPRFGGISDIAGILDEAAAAGVEGIVLPGVSPSRWERQESIRGVGPSHITIYYCYGIHPFFIANLTERELSDGLARLSETLAAEGVAVGECGLDGPSAKRTRHGLDRQIELLEAQLEIARRKRRPVVLHCFRAHGDLVTLLRRLGGLPFGGLLHSYSGSAELVPIYAELGCAFSFGGALTFSRARRPILAARAVPLDRIMVESDAPDQPPEPYRGRLNRPAYLPLIVEALARALGISKYETARVCAANTRRVFGLDPRRELENAW